MDGFFPRPHNINRIRMSVCLSVCLSVIVLLLNGKRWGHVNGTDRSAIYRHVFLYKKIIFPATLLGVTGQKADIANHLFFPFFSSFNPTIYKCEWPSRWTWVPMYGCTHVFDPPPPPPFLLIFFHIFFVEGEISLLKSDIDINYLVVWTIVIQLTLVWKRRQTSNEYSIILLWLQSWCWTFSLCTVN